MGEYSRTNTIYNKERLSGSKVLRSEPQGLSECGGDLSDRLLQFNEDDSEFRTGGIFDRVLLAWNKEGFSCLQIYV